MLIQVKAVSEKSLNISGANSANINPNKKIPKNILA